LNANTWSHKNSGQRRRKASQPNRTRIFQVVGNISTMVKGANPTPSTLKAFQVSLVIPVAYQFELRLPLHTAIVRPDAKGGNFVRSRGGTNKNGRRAKCHVTRDQGLIAQIGFWRIVEVPRRAGGALHSLMDGAREVVGWSLSWCFPFASPIKKGPPSFDCNPLIFLELAMGFEPATC
jgi:hypothetical protein